MRHNIDAYQDRGRGGTKNSKMQVKILYDIGCELERIADALEENEQT